MPSMFVVFSIVYQSLKGVTLIVVLVWYDADENSECGTGAVPKCRGGPTGCCED